jgi:hypothetical protein
MEVMRCWWLQTISRDAAAPLPSAYLKLRARPGVAATHAPSLREQDLSLATLLPKDQHCVSGLQILARRL